MPPTWSAVLPQKMQRVSFGSILGESVSFVRIELGFLLRCSARGDDFVDEAVGLSLFGGQPVIALGIAMNGFDGLAGMLRKDAFEVLRISSARMSKSVCWVRSPEPPMG